jgi:hypothetical protein
LNKQLQIKHTCLQNDFLISGIHYTSCLSFPIVKWTSLNGHFNSLVKSYGILEYWIFRARISWKYVSDYIDSKRVIAEENQIWRNNWIVCLFGNNVVFLSIDSTWEPSFSRFRASEIGARQNQSLHL